MRFSLHAAFLAVATALLPGAGMAQSLFTAQNATDGLAGLELAAFGRATPLVEVRHNPLQARAPAPLIAGPVRSLASPAPVPRDQARLRTLQTMPYTRADLDLVPRAAGSAEWRCLTEAIYFEARGEAVRGQFAVAEVILNRIDSPRYPDTVCKVVNEGTGRRHACQFSYTCDGIPERVAELPAWERAGKIARIMIDGAPRALTGNATHYHATYVSPNWARVYPRTAQVGTHLFYRYIPGA